MSLELEVDRGQYARDLLENPIFQEIWTNYEKQIVAGLKSCKPSDADAREKGVQMLVLLDNLKAMIQDTANTGTMAIIQLESKSRWEKIQDAIRATGMTG